MPDLSPLTGNNQGGGAPADTPLDAVGIGMYLPGTGVNGGFSNLPEFALAGIAIDGTSKMSNDGPNAFLGPPSTYNSNNINTGIPDLQRLEHPPFLQGQFMLGQSANAAPNPALMWQFQQQQQFQLQQQQQQQQPQVFPCARGGIPTGTAAPRQQQQQQQQPTAYWNAFSVIGSSRIEPFPERLHRLLREVEASGRTDVISWVNEGRGFEIRNSDAFFRDIVPHYFKQSKLASFKRQLGLYGFQLYAPDHTKGGSGTLKGYYAHQFFLKDMPDLCRKMRRINQHGTATFGTKTAPNNKKTKGNNKKTKTKTAGKE